MTPAAHPVARRLVPLAVLLTASLSACGATTTVDKQGAPSTAVTELTLGTADPQDAQLAFFVAAVDTASEHRLRIRVDPATYLSETPGGEAKLVGDVRSGAVAMGYVPSRDLAADGSPAFQALHAPMLLGTTADAVALSGTPVAKDVMNTLDDRGLHGLALVPLESRRLLSRTPILGPGDLKGARVRVNDSPQSAALLSAWSAVPVQGEVAATTKEELAAGRLDAVESSPQYVVPNGYFTSAPYLTSFGLFPKLAALVVTPKTWAGLSAADQAALTTAAAQTLTHATTDTPQQEATALSQLCSRGVVVVRPSEQALADLRAAAAKAGPTADAAPWVAKVQAALPSAAAGSGVAATGAATGPATGAATASSSCPVATSAAQAEELHAAVAASPSSAPSPSASAVAAPATFPTGTYTLLVTKEMWAAANTTSSNAGLDITFTSTFAPDGTFTQTQVPNPPDQGPYQGTYTVKGNTLSLDYVSVPSPSDRYQETVTWSYFKGDLRFTVVDVTDDGSKVMYAQPWRKVG